MAEIEITAPTLGRIVYKRTLLSVPSWEFPPYKSSRKEVVTHDQIGIVLDTLDELVRAAIWNGIGFVDSGEWLKPWDTDPYQQVGWLYPPVETRKLKIVTGAVLAQFE